MEFLLLVNGTKIPLESINRVWAEVVGDRFDLLCEVIGATTSSPGHHVVCSFGADNPCAAGIALRELSRLVRSFRDSEKVWAVAPNGRVVEVGQHG